MNVDLAIRRWPTPAFVSPQGKLKYDAVSRQAIVEVHAPTNAPSFVERIDGKGALCLARA